MSLFVMSDTHLSFGVDKPMTVFGCRWNNYTKKIEDNWRTVVGDEDTVVIAGDVSWAMTLDEAREDLLFLDSLPGTKILGRGNHDFWWDTVRKMTVFLESHNINSIKFLYNNAHAVNGITVCGSRGWYNDEKTAPADSDYKKIVLREAMRIELSLQHAQKLPGDPVVFLHFPPVYKNYVCNEILDVLHKYNIRRCYYGHIHTLYDIPASFIYKDIIFTITSSDYLNFTPLYVNTEHN
jgi:predicted phosphohydrolase